MSTPKPSEEINRRDNYCQVLTTYAASIQLTLETLFRGISARNLKGKHKKQPQSRKISDRKLKEKMRKGKLETFQSLSLFKYGYPVNLPFFF